MDRSLLHADIDELLHKLTVDEKISLLGAPNWWNTNGASCRYSTIGESSQNTQPAAIDRLKIPAVKMSDKYLPLPVSLSGVVDEHLRTNTRPKWCQGCLSFRVNACAMPAMRNRGRVHV
jgi:hypothetical protein